MKKLVVLMMAMLVASSAFAIVDPDNDMMGVYFDMNADMVCVEGAAPYSNHVAYLVLTNPTFDALYGYEAGLDIMGPAILLTNVFANPQALNVGDNTNQIVGFGAPTMTEPVTLLATMELLYTAVDGTPVEIHLHGTEPSSMDPMYPVVLLADGELRSYGISAADGLVAQINGTCGVVATEEMSFDNVKSLYR